MKIFVPIDNVYNKCYVVQNENVIRGYNKIPKNNSDYSYRDYYINSDYIFKDGFGSWSQYSTLPICLDNNVITNDFYYRLDFTNVLINLFILSFFCIYIPYKLIISPLFGKKLI